MKFTKEELKELYEDIEISKRNCDSAALRKLRKNSWTLEDREFCIKRSINW